MCFCEFFINCVCVLNKKYFKNTNLEKEVLSF
uniref:Uncharacterized protein n=1 Tax=viral metagenome TaxID=1070528 RepID=A0A6C0E1Z7_9ZZZZ